MTSKTDELKNTGSECIRCEHLQGFVNEAITKRELPLIIYQLWELLHLSMHAADYKKPWDGDDSFCDVRALIECFHVLDKNSAAIVKHIDKNPRSAPLKQCATCPNHNLRIVTGYIYGIGPDLMRNNLLELIHGLAYHPKVNKAQFIEADELVHFILELVYKIDWTIKSIGRKPSLAEKEL